MISNREDTLKDARIIAKNVKPDSKHRVNLTKSMVSDDVTFHVYRNIHGQIILDPQVSIPASEAWLFNNPEALESVRRGLKNASEGKVSKVDVDNL